MIDNKNLGNPELLVGYFEPMITKMVEDIVSEKIAKIRLKTEPERPILIDEVAHMLGYSVSHIYTLCRTKKIPHIKKGRWLHFYVSELNKWLEEGRVV